MSYLNILHTFFWLDVKFPSFSSGSEKLAVFHIFAQFKNVPTSLILVESHYQGLQHGHIILFFY